MTKYVYIDDLPINRVQNNGEGKLTLSDILISSEWEQIADMLSRMRIDVPGDDILAKKIRVETAMLKMLVHHQISSLNGNNTIDLSLFMGCHRIINRLEKHKKGDKRFLIFLKLLMYKLRKQKLRVVKRRERLDNFGRLKAVVENGNSPI